MIVGNHDRRADPPSHDVVIAVREGEVHIEADLLAMVSTIACDPKRKDDGTTREIESVRAIELNNL